MSRKPRVHLPRGPEEKIPNDQSLDNVPADTSEEPTPLIPKIMKERSEKFPPSLK
jgi:hypothetical protein